MFLPICRRVALAAFLLAWWASPAAGAWAAPPQSDPSSAPVEVSVAQSIQDWGARIILTFSRATEYRLEESRSRLRLVLEEPVSEASMIDLDVESDVLRRVRFDATDRGTEVIFYLGRDFDTFSSAELTDPFRVVLRFRRAGTGFGSQEEDSSPESGGEPGTGAEVEDPPGSAPALDEGVARVVIDPGHGGSEEGAVGRSGLKEKELVLDIARRLRSRLEEASLAVALTREEDQAVDLTSRTALANHQKADLFVSIHANSSSRPGAGGAETYFLSYGLSDEEAVALARREDSPGRATGSGRDRGDSGEIELVLWEMAQVEHLSRSSRLAELIQAEMNSLAGTKDRGVKQAPFRVLVGAAMPAVLVEVGFLTHSEEEKKLATQDYREQIAAALATAVGRFLQEIDLDGGGLASAPSGSPR